MCDGPSAQLTLSGEPFEVCAACSMAWEVETRPKPLRERCENCAYRPGSPESLDPEKRRWLARIVREGEPYHCHKGLPFKIDASERPIRTGPFLIWRDTPEGRDHVATLKLCAGWIAARRARKPDLEEA